MKKFLTSAVLALTLAGIGAHEASAWINSKFGVGLNWNYQSGGNSSLFGLFRNGQPPAPDCAVGGPGYGPAPAPCPTGGGAFHGLFTPGTDGGVSTQDAASAASVQGRTQSFNRPSSQTVNYQYPYYNYYYNNAYYGYGR